MPISAVAGPLIGAAGSLVGGLFGSSSASKAAAQQAAAGQKAVTVEQQANANATNALYTGMGEAQDRVNAGVTNANAALGTGLTGAQTAIGTGVGAGNAAIAGGLTGATGALTAGTGNANSLLGTIYNGTTGATAPYTTAGSTAIGQLSAGLAPGGDLAKNFTAADLNSQNPAYAFDLSQGQQALARAQAAAGTSLSGGAMEAMAGYTQQNALNAYQTAFNNFNANRQLNYGMLSGVAGMGQQGVNTSLQAAGLQSGNTMNAADLGALYNMQAGTATSGNQMLGAQLGSTAALGTGYQTSANSMNAGNMLGNIIMSGNEGIANSAMQAGQIEGNDYMGIGNAQAAGTVGAGNAWSNAFGGAANSLMQGLYKYNANNNPGGGNAAGLNIPSYTTPDLLSPSDYSQYASSAMMLSPI